MYNIRFVVVDGAGTVSTGASSFIYRDDVHIVPTDTDIFVDVS